MKKFLGAMALSAAFAVGGVANAQDYTLSVGGSATQDVDTTFDLTVNFDSSTGGDVSGWSLGLCHDATLFDIDSVADGSTTATVNGGSEPAFNTINVLPGEGFTVGLVIDLFGMQLLPPGTGYELNVATYTAGSTAGTGDLNFCNTLGTPSVDTVVVVNGASVTPATNGLTLELVSPPPPGFNYLAPNPTANFDQASGTGSFTAQFSIEEQATSPGFPNDTQGFSMAVAHDPAILSVTAGPNFLLPFTPDFSGPAVLADGWTIGTVYSFTSANVAAFATATPVIEIEYAISGLAGSGATSTPLNFSNALGSPTVDNVVVVAGLSLDAAFVDGAVNLEPVTDTPFLRGDCNSDLKADIADGIWILNFLFQGGPAGACAEACDADDNGDLDMLDAMSIIQYRLLNGPAPAAPFPECGIEAGADCDASACP